MDSFLNIKSPSFLIPHIVKAVAFEEDLQPEFKDYAEQIVKNAKTPSNKCIPVEANPSFINNSTVSIMLKNINTSSEIIIYS